MVGREVDQDGPNSRDGGGGLVEDTIKSLGDCESRRRARGQCLVVSAGTLWQMLTVPLRIGTCGGRTDGGPDGGVVALAEVIVLAFRPYLSIDGRQTEPPVRWMTPIGVPPVDDYAAKTHGSTGIATGIDK